MKVLTASDRKNLIRLAASLPKGSADRRAILAGLQKTSEKWIQKAIKRPGRVRDYLGVKEGETIPMGKLKSEIEKLRSKKDKTKEETSLLRALNMAVTLKK